MISQIVHLSNTHKRQAATMLVLSLVGHVKPESQFSIGFHSAPPCFGYFHSGELSIPQTCFWFFLVFPGKLKQFHNRVRSFLLRTGFFHAIHSGTVKIDFQPILLFWPSQSGTVAAGSQRTRCCKASIGREQRSDSWTLSQDFYALK